MTSHVNKLGLAPNLVITRCTRVVPENRAHREYYKYVSSYKLRLYVWRKSDLPLYIGQTHAFYFDTTPYTLNDNVNTKSVRLNNLIDDCLWYCIERT